MSDINNEQPEEQKAIDSEKRDRLLDATCRIASERMELGPQGLHEGCDFDRVHWRVRSRFAYRGYIKFPEDYVIFWCRLYLCVVTIDSHTALIQYSLENMYDGDLPININGKLFAIFGGLDRFWLAEDVTTCQKSEYSLPTKGIHSITTGRNSFEYLKPSEILTITSKASFKDDSWFLDYFGDCLPGHTYKFQFTYGGLPSNVFTWTAPE